MAILKDLIVHGSSRFLNKIYASEIQTPLIEAEAGVFKKLKADDATVVGLLDVKGQLHTNNWSNSNIATIDGSFYITPTIGSASGTVTITASSLVFSGTNYAVSNLYLGDGSSITWPQYSKVLITGQILSNGEWIPLGTLLGQLSSTATAASISINNIKDNKNQASNVLTTLVNEGTTSSSYRNLKVSLYQRASSSTAFYPLGIYMTATGTNGRTFLDIYGGVEALNNSNNYGGFAEPNVRIGNLQGLPNVGGQTPSGWGIYTDNGYFKGIIAADRGYIGSGSKYWVIANEEDLSNVENSRSFIYNGTNSISSSTPGIYLGTDGIRNYEDSTHFVTIKDGVITAQGVDLSGTINASSGYIAGWRIASTYLSSTTASAPGENILILSPKGTSNSYTIASQAKTGWMITAGTSFGVNKDGGVYASKGKIGGWAIDGNSLTMGTWGTDNSAMICTGSSSAKSVGGSEATVNGWIFTAGANFGVTKTGALYASSANISGKVVATSGSIGGVNIVDGNLDVSSISIGSLGDANNYAQKIDLEKVGETVTYYLLSEKSEGVTSNDVGWTLTPGIVTEEKKYLWAYQVTKYGTNDENYEITEKASIVSFYNKKQSVPLKSLVVDIDPVQDLHGYDSPWVGGGGSNKWDEQWEVGSLTWTGADATGTNKIRSKGYIPVVEGETYRVVTSNNLQFFYYDSTKAFVSYESSSKANGSTITIPTGCAYLRFYTYGTTYGETYKNDIAVNYPSTVTTYSPYENICPISGWEGCEVNATGKNLWNDSIAPTDIEAYSINGSKGTYKGRNLYLPKGTYTFSYNGTTIAYIYGNVVNADGSWVSSFRLTKPDSLTPTFTLSDGQYAKLYIASGAITELTNGNIQLELGSTATSYEPYHGQTIPISWQTEAGTVYGGKLDVLSGELTVDGMIVDLSTFTPSVRATEDINKTISISLPYPYVGYPDSMFRGFVCSKYAYKGYSAGALGLSHPDEKEVGIYHYRNSTNTTTQTVYFVLPKDSDLDGELVFFLTEPQTYQLTPMEVHSLLGQNNIFADTGDVEVTYSINAIKTEPYIVGTYDNTEIINNISTVANTALGQSVWYAECSTAAGTAVKVATISPVTTNFVLINGTTVNVKFANTNSASSSSLQLNINGTGAKNIKYIYNGTYNNIQTGYLKANQMYQFRYDGTYWIVQMMYNTNNYDRSLYAMALQASEVILSARVAVLGLDGKLHLLNSSSFLISCPLLYVGNEYSADNVTNSFSRSTNYSYWGTSFNLTNTHSIQNATANTNVYVVGTLSGDIFTPNITVLTCAEPTTEDGLYYMLLGRMTSTTNAILQAEHPIYIYKNGNFQKLEATTATSYITYIDANNGIKIHNESDTLNYLQLNSTAISMYRNNIETLNINNNEIRIGKISGNNVCIDNDSIDIRNEQTVLSSFGNNAIIIGQYGKSRLMLSPTMISGISDIGYKNFNIISGDSSEEETTITKSGNFENESSETGVFHGSINFSERFYYFHKITATVVFNYVWNSEQQTTDPLTLDIDDPEDETGNIWFIGGSVVNSSYVLEYRITCSTQHNGEMTYVYFDTDAQLTPKNTSIPVSYEIESTAPYSIVIETKVYKNTSYTFGSRKRNSEQGNNSFTIGEQLIASSDNQLAIGVFNNDDPNKNYAFMVGNGIYDENHKEHRSNAFTVDCDGNTEVMGNLEVNNNQIVTNNSTVGGNETVTGDLTANRLIGGALHCNGVSKFTGKMTYNGVGGLFFVKSYVYNTSIAANGTWYHNDQTGITITNYKAIAIAGFGVWNDGGSCDIIKCYIWNDSDTKDVLDVGVKNRKNAAVTVNVYVKIFYIARNVCPQ